MKFENYGKENHQMELSSVFFHITFGFEIRLTYRVYFFIIWYEKYFGKEFWNYPETIIVSYIFILVCFFSVLSIIGRVNSMSRPRFWMGQRLNKKEKKKDELIR